MCLWTWLGERQPRGLRQLRLEGGGLRRRRRRHHHTLKGRRVLRHLGRAQCSHLVVNGRGEEVGLLLLLLLLLLWLLLMLLLLLLLLLGCGWWAVGLLLGGDGDLELLDEVVDLERRTDLHTGQVHDLLLGQRHELTAADILRGEAIDQS